MIERWLRTIGGDVERHVARMSELARGPDYPGREVEREDAPFVQATIVGARPGPHVLLTGHVDVVPPGDPAAWSADPFEPRIEGDRLHGRGAADMKGGIVSLLAVYEAFARADFAGTVTFLAVPGEEDGGTGTLAALRRGQRPTSSSSPNRRQATTTSRRPSSRTPESLVAEIRVGVALGESIDEADTRVRETIATAAARAGGWLADHPPKVERSGGVYRSARTPTDDALVRALREASAAVFGAPATLAAMPYGCDMGQWRHLTDATVVVYGPGRARVAHTVDEWVALSAVAKTAEVLERTVRRLT